MAQSTFSLSWDSHKNNICNGLSILQQNEEFVDMTLAADGHHVKVHQMVMALASPYIKDLISSAACPHPIIFLNKISYKTLSSILEYIYTGEVLVSVDNLTDLIEAARELHIKGLEEMDIEGSLKSPIKNKIQMISRSPVVEVENDEVYFEIAVSDRASPGRQSSHYTLMDDGIPEDSESSSTNLHVQDEEEMTDEECGAGGAEAGAGAAEAAGSELGDGKLPARMQFTVSNQGSLQMILNRYMYYLKHSNRNNSRQWRCVDYLNRRKCAARVVTRDHAVLQRISAHSHPFHDRRILKKVYANAVFAALRDAESRGRALKTSRHARSERGSAGHASTEHGSAEHGSAEHGSAEHGSAEHERGGGQHALL